jgi:hypothetical protein
MGGWLSLLAATTPIDLHRDHAATSEHPRTAAQLARKTGHAEIAAWVPENPACQVRTTRITGGPVDITRPPSGSPGIRQRLHPGDRARRPRRARLGADPETRAALSRVEALVSPP